MNCYSAFLTLSLYVYTAIKTETKLNPYPLIIIKTSSVRNIFINVQLPAQVNAMHDRGAHLQLMTKELI